MEGRGWVGARELRRRLGKGDGGVHGRVWPLALAMASTPWSNSSRLGSLMEGGVLGVLRRASLGSGEYSPEEAMEPVPGGRRIREALCCIEAVSNLLSGLILGLPDRDSGGV